MAPAARAPPPVESGVRSPLLLTSVTSSTAAPNASGETSVGRGRAPTTTDADEDDRTRPGSSRKRGSFERFFGVGLIFSAALVCAASGPLPHTFDRFFGDFEDVFGGLGKRREEWFGRSRQAFRSSNRASPVGISSPRVRQVAERRGDASSAGEWFSPDLSRKDKETRATAARSTQEPHNIRSAHRRVDAAGLRSSAPIGARFWGARGSLCGTDTKRGSATGDRVGRPGRPP